MLGSSLIECVFIQEAYKLQFDRDYSTGLRHRSGKRTCPPRVAISGTSGAFSVRQAVLGELQSRWGVNASRLLPQLLAVRLHLLLTAAQRRNVDAMRSWQQTSCFLFGL